MMLTKVTDDAEASMNKNIRGRGVMGSMKILLFYNLVSL